MNLIWQLLVGTWELAEENVHRLRAALVAMMMWCIGLIIIMWGINALGGKEVNYVFFFLGGIFLILKASNPRIAGASAIAGSTVQGLRDEDLSQSAVKGVVVLYRVMLGLLLGFWILAGLLSTWSFKEAPAAFFPIAAMALTIAVTVEFFNMKGGIFKWVVIGYALGVILVAFWQTVPADWKSKTSQASTSNASIQPSSQGQSFSAKWSRNDDGTIPVGVWSETVTIQPGCGIRYNAGNRTIYKTQYRYNSKEWKQHDGGQPNMNEVQFALLHAGVDDVRYRIVCY